MREPTPKMREEAAVAGFYESPWRKHPRLQLLTIADLLSGGRIDQPAPTGSNVTFKQASRARRKDAEQLDLNGEE